MKPHLQVKKLKVDIFTPPRQNSLPAPDHHPKGRGKLLIPRRKGEDYKNLFRKALLKFSSFKIRYRKIQLLLKGTFGEFEKVITHGLQLICLCHYLSLL